MLAVVTEERLAEADAAILLLLAAYGKEPHELQFSIEREHKNFAGVFIFYGVDVWRVLSAYIHTCYSCLVSLA